MPLPSTVKRLPLWSQCLRFSSHTQALTTNTAYPPLRRASQVAPLVHLSPQGPLSGLWQEAQRGM